MPDESNNPVDQMKDWAHRAPPPDGPVPDGDLGTYLKAKRMVAILLTDTGQAFHIGQLDLKGANLVRLDQPRSAVLELMDQLGIADGPDWNSIGD